MDRNQPYLTAFLFFASAPLIGFAIMVVFYAGEGLSVFCPPKIGPAEMGVSG